MGRIYRLANVLIRLGLKKGDWVAVLPGDEFREAIASILPEARTVFLMPLA